VTRADEIAENLGRVRARLAQAERAANRTAGSVRLLAVSKTKPIEDLAAAAAAGQRDFGENYAQELRDKRAACESGTAAGFDSADLPRWHFIGPLQSNKVKYLAGRVDLIHTIDSVALLDEIERRATGLDPGPARGPAAPQECLIQVNLASESQKRGIPASQVEGLLDLFADRPHLRCVGLMVIPPFADDPAASQPHFAALRQLRDDLAPRARVRVDLRELSMGMSHDLEVAVAEGATIVRIGTAIFGAREPRA
jgi:pyridoxal phosphate enzyme (YggS family)